MKHNGDNIRMSCKSISVEEKDDGPENGEEEEGPGERKLKKQTQRRTKSLIDCEVCAAYNCYRDEENLDDSQMKQEEDDSGVADWIANLAECQETGVQWNGMDLYVGAMCSPYGDGVELAVFVDEDCTMYTNQKTFSSVYTLYNDEDVNYSALAEKYIKNAFSEEMPCLEQEFADPNEEQGDNDAKYEVNSYCQQILNGGAADFNSCAGDENEVQDENNNVDEEDEQYSWYTYDMTAQNAENVEAVCSVLKKMEGEYSHLYDERSSGTWYSRNRNGQILKNEEYEKKGFSGGVVTSILCICLGAVGAAAYVLKSKQDAGGTEATYQGGTLS